MFVLVWPPWLKSASTQRAPGMQRPAMESPKDHPSQLLRRPNDQINTRILQTMISGLPLIWALESEGRILVFMWPFGPLATAYIRQT